MEFPAERNATVIEWIQPVVPYTKSQFVAPSTVDHDPLVQGLVDTLSRQRIQDTVYNLSLNYFTRNSLSALTVEAGKYLLERAAGYGCVNGAQQFYRAGYAPNVFCYFPGESTSQVIVVGAHYDSRTTNVNDNTTRAPGADDNASGSAGVLEILAASKALNLRYRKTILFAWFSGEEQGLLGSAALANELRANSSIKIEAMINLDMIGYPQPNDRTALYWFQNSVSTSLTNLGIELSQLYLPGASVKRTSACCSDQASFNSVGIPAAAVFESLSAGNNPNYHRSSDLPDTVDYNHVHRLTQCAAALIGTLAEPF